MYTVTVAVGERSTKYQPYQPIKSMLGPLTLVGKRSPTRVPGVGVGGDVKHCSIQSNSG